MVGPLSTWRCDAEGRQCTLCTEYRPWSEFRSSTGGRGGKRSRCRSCMSELDRRRHDPETAARQWREWSAANRERWLRSKREARRALTPQERVERNRRYGLWTNFRLTPEHYDELLRKQSGVCAICGEVDQAGKNLHVDHDHSHCPGRKSCGECVRGLLCGNCNHLLGKAKDSISLLQSAIYYLAPWQGEHNEPEEVLSA